MSRWLRRGVRSGVRWWWRNARPATGGAAPRHGVARPAHETGRPPRPDERWTPSVPATGPWAEVRPEVAGRWPRRGTVLVLAGWATAVGVRVRRDLRTWRAGG